MTIFTKNEGISRRANLKFHYHTARTYDYTKKYDLHECLRDDRCNFKGLHFHQTNNSMVRCMIKNCKTTIGRKWQQQEEYNWFTPSKRWWNQVRKENNHIISLMSKTEQITLKENKKKKPFTKTTKRVLITPTVTRQTQLDKTTSSTMVKQTQIGQITTRKKKKHTRGHFHKSKENITRCPLPITKCKKPTHLHQIATWNTTLPPTYFFCKKKHKRNISKKEITTTNKMAIILKKLVDQKSVPPENTTSIPISILKDLIKGMNIPAKTPSVTSPPHGLNQESAIILSEFLKAVAKNV